MPDLIQTIVNHTHNTPVTEISKDVLTQIQITLQHRDLPKLEAAGIIKYDPERQLVEPTKLFDRLRPTLSAIVDADLNLDSPVG